MPELLTDQIEALLRSSLNFLPPGSRAQFEQTWRAELGGVPEGQERLEFAKGLPAAARQLGVQLDFSARFMRLPSVLTGSLDVCFLLDVLFIHAVSPASVLGMTALTLGTGLHLMLAVFVLVRAYRRVVFPGGSRSGLVRTLRQAGLASGLTVAAAAATWRGVLDPAASPFLMFLLLVGLLAGSFDFTPQDLSERETA